MFTLKTEILEKFEIVVKTLFGFEEILAAELREIGASDIEILTRAVKFKGNNELLYKSNLLLRTAIKVLKPIASFNANNEEQLYQKVRGIDWSEYMTVDDTLAIDGITFSDVFTHSQYIALKTKDAIVDQFRDKFGVRPNVDIENPNLRINVHIADTTVSISLDSSGKSLGKRGYKTEQNAAPLSEVMAAGIIMLSGWDKSRPFIDPMCGSGTIPIEAALIARNIPAGNFRHFTFENWKDFDASLWEEIKREANAKIVPYNSKIMGFDIDSKTVRIARDNAKRAGVDDIVEVEHMDFFETSPGLDNAHLVMNPPYGERLEEKEDMIDLYKAIGDHFKQHYNGCDAWVLSGNLDAIKFIGLRPSRKIWLYNGPIECKLHKFEMYRGSKKASKQENQS